MELAWNRDRRLDLLDQNLLDPNPRDPNPLDQNLLSPDPIRFRDRGFDLDGCVHGDLAWTLVAHRGDESA